MSLGTTESKWPTFRMDVRYMTRRDLFRSAREFLVVGLVGCLVSTVVAWALFRDAARAPGAIATAVVFALFLLTAIYLLGALYLFVRGMRRHASYDPDVVWQADQAKWADWEADDNEGGEDPGASGGEGGGRNRTPGP